jgi:peptide/nickel transport system substrate-binding protein
VALVIAVAGCGSSTSATTATQPHKGGILKFARLDEPGSLNPIQAADNGAFYDDPQIFDTLVEMAPNGVDLVPGLATSWTVSADGMTYTFHLRQAKFSNGSPVTAQDVKFSLDRAFDQKLDATYGFAYPNVKDSNVVDASTVSVDMTAPDASFLGSMTLSAAMIVPQSVVESEGEDGFATQPIGSGPFMLKSWVRGSELDLVRNPNYWKPGLPYLDGIDFVTTADDNTRMLKVQSGEAQIGDNVPVSQVSQLNQIAGLKVLNERALAIWTIILNENIPQLADVKVRQALNYATPKDTINKVTADGLGTIANSMTPQTRFWDKSVPPYPYDINKAKELMSQSSAPNGFTLNFVIQAGDSMESQLATIIQSEWAKIGVTTNIQVVDHATRIKDTIAQNYGALSRPATALNSDFLDDSELATILLDGTSSWKSMYTGYNSTQIEQLIHQAATSTDDNQRRQLYSQIQKMGMADAPMVPLLYMPYLTVVSSKVQGFKTLPSGWWILANVWLS